MNAFYEALIELSERMFKMSDVALVMPKNKPALENVTRPLISFFCFFLRMVEWPFTNQGKSSFHASIHEKKL